MIIVSVNLYSLLFQSPANDASWFSLSHTCAQVADTDTLAWLKGPCPAMICSRYDHVASDFIDLFLDFIEKFPHSHTQTGKHDD